MPEDPRDRTGTPMDFEALRDYLWLGSQQLARTSAEPERRRPVREDLRRPYPPEEERGAARDPEEPPPPSGGDDPPPESRPPGDGAGGERPHLGEAPGRRPIGTLRAEAGVLTAEEAEEGATGWFARFSPEPSLRLALRPLGMRRSDPRREELDIATTITQAADLRARTGRLPDGRWPAIVPVTRAARERSLRLTLLLDDSFTMRAHRHQVADFVRQVRSGAGVREVRVLRMDTEDGGSEGLRLYLEDGSPGPPAHALFRAEGREAALLVTDGCAKGWDGAELPGQLHRWSRQAALAIRHLLPRPLWARTGIRPHLARLAAPEPHLSGTLTPNRSYRHRPAESPRRTRSRPAADAAGTVAVPVLPADPEDLGRWARFLAREEFQTDYLVDALAVPEPDTGGFGEGGESSAGARGAPAPPEEPDAETAVRRFAEEASPAAFDLAVRLAAVPLNMPLIEAVHADMGTRAGPAAVTEVLGSGLLYREQGDPDTAAAAALEFRPGVRERLLGAGGDSDITAHVLGTVAARFADAVPVLAELAAALRGDASLPAAEELSEEERRMLASVLPAVRLLPGNRYRVLAAHLRGATGSGGGEPAQGETHVLTGLPAESAQHSGGRPPVSSGQDHTAPEPSDPSTTSTTEPPMLNDPSDSHSAAAQTARPQPTMVGVPPQNRFFTGRGEVLAELHTALREGTGSVTVLQGMAGMGKSELAAHYIHRFRENYTLIGWISAWNETEIETSLVRLAEQIGVTLPAGTLLEQARAALRALHTGAPHSHWLLVYDGAGAPDSLLSLLPTGGPGRILVTSTDRSWQHNGGARVIEVDVFQRHESVELLRRRGPENLTEAEADHLAERLGDLPLALPQVAAYLRDTLTPATDYLRMFDQRADELLDAATPVDNYRDPLMVALDLSLERLRGEDGEASAGARDRRGALLLLQVCAFYAPAPLPRSFFLRGTDVEAPPALERVLGDSLNFNRALRQIGRYSLAYLDGAQNTFRLHPLIQQTLRRGLSEEETRRLRDCAHRLLGRNDPHVPEDPGTWERYGALLPHIYVSQAWSCTDSRVRDLVLHTMQFLRYFGDYSNSLWLAERALEEWGGHDDRRALRVGLHRAEIRSVLGEDTGAHAEAAELVERFTELYGADDEETMNAQWLLAVTTEYLGRRDESHPMFEELFERRSRILGEEDPLTLDAAHSLASSLQAQGRFLEALPIDEENHERRRTVLGEHSRDTLRSQLSVAANLLACGRTVEAEPLLSNAHALWRSTVGEGNVIALDTAVLWSVALRRLGRYQEAVALSNDALGTYARRYAPTFPLSVKAAIVHSGNLCLAGDAAAAVRAAEDAQSRVAELYSEEHPWAGYAKLALAVALRRTDRHAEAYDADTAALRILAEAYPAGHPGVLSCRVNLGNGLFHLGRMHEARDSDAEAAEACERVLGAEHPFTLAARYNLALADQALGEPGAAERLEELARRYRRLLPEGNPLLLSLAENGRAECDSFPAV